MRKTPVSAARRRLKFGGISERKQTELIHHPVCLNLSGVCLPFGWKEINSWRWPVGIFYQLGVCLQIFLLSDWFQLRIQTVRLRTGPIPSNGCPAFGLDRSQHRSRALEKQRRIQ